MDSIFHERQEGQLCAQHCLNNLLQAPYFTAVDLAKLARELDEAEKVRMAEGGFDSPEYLQFLKEPSANMDDSGFFSGQVISKALAVWNLTIEPISSPQMKTAMENPSSQKAFICNHDLHWLTVRKLGRQWFNLDSLQRRPKLVSDTYLSLFLTQLQMEGYAIFTVLGNLPECEADQLLTLLPVVLEKDSNQPTNSKRKEKHFSPVRSSKPLSSSPQSTDDEESYALELATAMSFSTCMTQKREQNDGDGGTGSGSGSGSCMATTSAPFGGHASLEDEERFKVEMVAAIHASIEDTKEDSTLTTKKEDKKLSPEELREKRLLHIEKSRSKGPGRTS